MNYDDDTVASKDVHAFDLCRLYRAGYQLIAYS